ncbi:MAG: SAM-dependent methyltransferase [Candidatus Amulumruptor caecigallinarius]|nr:MAG: SAM-dependent methyltransferase [Candidatus Amulumruptor caecigallinarius]
MKGIYYNNSVATSQTPSQEHGNAPDGPGTLYLMPVPMSDAHPSTVLPTTNIELASRIKYFIVENVRSARRFLKRCDPSIVIDELHFEVLNVDTAPETVDAMIKPLTGGHDMAIISEAGCPAVADPGALAVAAAQRKGVKVVPLVGPSSILMALMGSGFNGQSFAFRGYLPIKPDERQAALKRMEKRIQSDNQTQIFIETPYRNNKLIDTLIRTLHGATKLCVASDITGPNESIITRPLSGWATATYNYDKIPTIFLLYK